MEENEKETKCSHCENEASESIWTSNHGTQNVCADHVDEFYFICSATGDYCLFEDGEELGDEMYSPDGIDEVRVYCEWSGDAIHMDDSYCVNGDYYIREDLSDEVGRCYDCEHESHYEDMQYHENSDEYYCDGCTPHSGNEWYGNFKFLNENTKPKPSEIRNWIGIEFEMEEAYDGPDQSDVPYIAVCEHDGSLGEGGLEYKTNVIRGKDIKQIIDDFCMKSHEYGMNPSASTVGWHFHYSLANRQDGHIRNISHACVDFSNLIQSAEGFNYFRNMLRGYARPMESRYKDAVKKWDGKTSFGNYIRNSSGYPSRGTFVNFSRLFQGGAENIGNLQRRVEIRMYSPSAYLYDTNLIGRNWNHEDLAKDYYSFIQFWDEFIRKSAVKRLVMTSEMNLDTFSQQFTPKVKDWLKSRENASVMPHTRLGGLRNEITYSPYAGETTN